MKKLFLLLFFASSAIAATAQDDKVFVNDKNAEVRNVSGFTSISVASGIDLYLSPGDKETVVVSASDIKYRDKIVTRVDGSTLKIYFDDKSRWFGNEDRKMRAYVSYKTLSRLSASGASDVYVNGFIQANDLEIHLSGSSDFKGAVKVGNLKLDQSGSSDSKITGTAEKVNIDLSGSSDVKGFELISNYVYISSSGSSDVQITVNKEMSVHSSGASDVYYMGTGTIREMKTSGASSITRKDKGEVKIEKEDI
jgi:hypothetical protein